MVSYLQIENVTKSFGDRILFDSITFGVNQGDKIGIIAKNGTGKSTLLNIIAGKEDIDSGKITFRNDLKISVVPQTPVFPPDATVMEACFDTFSPKGIATARYESALQSGNAEEINEALHLMDAADAWDYDDRIKQLLTQLHITDLTARIATLSGGQHKRIAIARAILDNPDLIILDEPTNHLDIDVIEWLENYLSRNNLTILLVTHDRYFLDRVCNKIIEIDRQSIYTYEGNFDYYLRKRAERIEALGNELAKVKNTLRKEQEWMNRQPQARAGKAKYRIDSFYELKERSKVNLREDNINLDNMNSGYIGSKIFEAKNVCKKYGDKVILNDFNYIFSRYEKVGIIGANGVGKSTFIKMLLGLVKTDSGHFDIGSTVRFGYYCQDGIQFDENKKVIDAVTEIADDIILKENIHLSPMQFLNHFLFSPADQQKYIHTLSGGERCRLHLATVLMRRPNFLILDEPTNDLDIVTLRILEDYLSNFQGCLIVVSHDRYFLDNITEHLFVLDGTGKVKDFPGNYSDYRLWLSEQEKLTPEKQPAVNKQTKTRAERKEKLSYKERKELESLTQEIELLTEEKNKLDALFSSGTELDNVAELSTRYNALSEELDEKELRWLELSERE
ncbi:MAG: ABC-F family ATP-binding cassette domain-containing protein [Paramuribaculum sp.]|nr:ABC-F family ATP-binding cassette domain-containing protein [Paramuribaculum sp.]